MDHIDEKLATAAIDDDYPPAIQAALAIGKKTLNRYYDKTDHSEVFRIAMGMIFLVVLLYISFLFVTSVAPSSQASIFQKSGMGG